MSARVEDEFGHLTFEGFEEALGNWLDEGSPWSAVSLEEVC
jgi:hypothetical protein